MSVRPPLVLNAGRIQQLQSGDTISAPPELVSLTNANGSTINICAPVYVSSAAHVDLAKGDATSTTDVIGLVYDTTIASGAAGNVIVDGIMTATTGQWDAIAGTSGGLTAGAVYYLSAATAGLLTATAPSTAGQFAVPVGRALSTTQLELTLPGPVVAL